MELKRKGKKKRPYASQVNDGAALGVQPASGHLFSRFLDVRSYWLPCK